MSGLGLGNVFAKFSQLRNLKTLNFNDNPNLGQNPSFRDVFADEVLPQMTHLFVENVGLDDGRVLDVLSRGWGKNVKVLRMDRNKLLYIEPGIKTSMPNLEHVSITQNQLLAPLLLTTELLTLKHLKFVNLSNQNPFNRFRTRRYTHVLKALCLSAERFSCALQFPQNLTYLDLSLFGFQYFTIPTLILMRNSSLEFVNLSGNFIGEFPKPFYCAQDVMPPFKIVNLSMNRIKCFKSTYFTHCDWSALNVLNLAYNNLNQGNILPCSNKTMYFLEFLRPLSNLTKIDLSGNILDTDLSADTFTNQKNLQELKLSNMSISHLPIQLHHMLSLQTLDLSNNKIQCLSINTMREISNLTDTQENTFGKVWLHLDLHGNPLSCNCQCYSFYRWLNSTNAMLTGRDKLVCSIADRKFSLSNIRMLLIKLNANCFPQTWLRTNIQVVGIVYLVIIFLSILRRKKYFLYFLYLKWRVLLVSKLAAEEVRTFHAFISYAEQDRKWVYKRLLECLENHLKLKLFVASRDFALGQLITANIHFAITASTKTVFVISKSFLKSAWCLEEFSTALSVSFFSLFILGRVPGN